MSTGILVHGGNHLILSGPLPAPSCAERLAAVFGMALVRVGPPARSEHGAWRIRTREFRERLEWAVQLTPEREPSTAVAALLTELAARGIVIRRMDETWEGYRCD